MLAVTVRIGRLAPLLAGLAAGAFLARGWAAEARPRPDSFRRCTLPITALRLTPPSWVAIWLALSPSAQSLVRSSTRSSVQFMSTSSCYSHARIRIPSRPACCRHDNASTGVIGSAALNLGISWREGTVWGDSVTRVGQPMGIGICGFPQLERVVRPVPVRWRYWRIAQETFYLTHFA